MRFCVSEQVLSLYPTSSFISRIVEAFGGVGQKFLAGVLQVEEIAVGGCAGAARCPGAAFVLRHVEPFAGASEQLAA